MFDFKHIVSSFRHELRDVTVSTDFIVGFPSETAEDFRATVDLLREVTPLKVNITRFSRREGTAAFFLKPVTGRVQKDRSRMLTAEHHRVARQRNREVHRRELQGAGSGKRQEWKHYVIQRQL